MKTLKLMSKASDKASKQVLAALVAWTMAFTLAMAAAQEKAQPQKADGALQSQPRPAPKISADSHENAAKSERSSGPQEGIKVHGHWVIEVRNPDGSLASRTKFENGLTSFGVSALIDVLSQNSSVGPWSIWFTGSGSPGTFPCRGTAPSPPACVISQGALNFSQASGNLTFGYGGTSVGTDLRLVTFGPAGGGNTALELHGTGIVPNSGIINAVATFISLCIPPGPSSCGSSPLMFQLTQANPSPITVSAGQYVQFTVTISFS